MSRHLRDMDDILRHLRQFDELVNPALHVQEMLDKLRPTLALTDIASPLLRHNLQQQMISDIVAKLSSTDAISEILKQNTSCASVIARIAEQQRSIADLLRPHVEFKADLSLGVSALVDASSVWKSATDATLARFNQIGLVGVRDDLVDRLLAPSRAFGSFMQSASERLDDSLSATRLIAANSALKIIEGQFDTITGALTTMPSLFDLRAPLAERALVAPVRQFDASLEVELDEAEQSEPEQRIAQLPLIRCAEDARTTVMLVCRANEVRASAGKGEIFKPTTRFAEACADIGWLVAEDKKSFADVIDCLYFIFYEGAGKDKLRFLEEHGGPVKPEEADFIWCMKHLRNKYSRHDPDHGKPSEIARSWADLQQKWVALGLSVAPHKKNDFLLAQQALLRMARQFAETLLSRLAGGGTHT